MNHLGDTNKMVETPRTETYVLNPLPQVVSAEWARQLERELNAANDRIKRLEEMYEGVIGEQPELLGSNVMGLLKRELNDTQRRIKRLEEENNELRSEEARLLNTKGELERRIKRLEEAGDKMEPWSERVGQEFWRKAKEAKQ